MDSRELEGMQRRVYVVDGSGYELVIQIQFNQPIEELL